jgi:hypothetical protein
MAFDRTPKPSRRFFLRGAGACVGLPWLASLPNTARAADGFPLRFVVFTHGQGTITDAMVAPGGTENTWDFGEILASLAPRQSDVVVIEGIDDATNLLDTPYNGHTRCRLHSLTAQGMHWAPDGAGGAVPTSAGGPSIDQFIANKWAGLTPYDSLEFGVSVGTLTGNTYTWKGIGQPVPPEDNPSAMFDRLFLDLATSDPAEVAARITRRQSVLDAVKSQFDHLMPRLGGEDRVRLENHLESIRGLEQAVAGGVLGDACQLPTPDLTDTSVPGDTRAHIDMLTMSLACDITRVATLAIGGINEFPWLPDLNFPTGWHDSVHAGPVTPDLRADLIGSYAWFAEQFQYLLDSLAAVPEGDGTLLDHTLVLYSNVFSTGASHDHTGKYYLLGGGACGALQGGRYLSFDHKPHGELYAAILQGMGFTDTCFGDPAFCDGPLTGIF